MLVFSMKTLLKGWRFERGEPLTGDADVIRWWEIRRPFFNVVVGCTGLLTCVLMLACAFIAEPIVGEAIGLPDGAVLGLAGILMYGILANICYTGGWFCELLLRSATTAKTSSSFGVRAFRIGMIFSVFLTLCPAVLSWVVFTIALLSGQKHAPQGEY